MLGNILKLVRIYNGLEVKEASKQTGLDSNLIKKLEKGKSRIYLGTLEKFERLYGMPISQMLLLNDMQERFYFDDKKILNDIKIYYICKTDEEKTKVKRIGV